MQNFSQNLDKKAIIYYNYDVFLAKSRKRMPIDQGKEQAMKKIFSAVTTSLLIIVAILAIMLAGVRLFGITPYTVLSGSMEPSIHVGSLIYTVKPDTSKLEVGDVITYVIEGGTVVTHRIIEVVPDENDASVLRFKTKGDNNNTADTGEPIHQNNVLGKMLFTIPYLGYLAWFVQNPPGSYITIGFGIVLILLTFLPELLDKLEDDPNAPKTVAEDEGGSGEKAESGDTDASAEDSADTEPTPSSDPPSDQPPNGEDGEEELESTPQTEGLQEISSLADAEEKN